MLSSANQAQKPSKTRPSHMLLSDPLAPKEIFTAQRLFSALQVTMPKLLKLDLEYLSPLARRATMSATILWCQGKKKMQQVSPTPTQTVETLKEDVQWAKARNR